MWHIIPLTYLNIRVWNENTISVVVCKVVRILSCKLKTIPNKLIGSDFQWFKNTFSQPNFIPSHTLYIRCNFLWHNYDFWSLRTLKSINWNIPKRSMDLDLSLVVMAKFYSTFSNCFIYLLFSTRRPP